ncbi:t-SNARE [Jaminaea rosea]|uniref:t-SNARE n=1 Tax=Jaminaea rosea TaxID=1569628 RepID=A0A316UQC6_9BASI|nr:t-SNARE [Jaminaea rosea]PWN26998.1 t-SNARE [Jaminaea rosea]
MSYYSGYSAAGSSSSNTSFKDRTNELRSYVHHFKAASSAANPNGAAAASSSAAAKKQPTKGEFAIKAAAIGKDITDTTAKLARLAQLAKKKSLFDDRPVEISELTYIIKHDLAAINRQLADLQAQSKGAQQQQQKKGRLEEHRSNVVTLLQSNLASATTAFQDVLEVRTQNMKMARDRTEQFAYGGQGGGPSGGMQQQGDNSVLRSRQPPSSQILHRPDSPLYNPTRQRGAAAAAAGRSQPASAGADDGYDPKAKGGQVATRAGGYQALPPDDRSGGAGGGGGGDDFLALDMGGGRSDQFMQMQLMENGENQYMQQRSTAIESIESTISELGQIFSQLAHMVAEQRETVQRIDDNIMDVADNVSGAQRELLKYYNSVASNRWLMLKIFGVLIVFFLLFILVS